MRRNMLLLIVLPVMSGCTTPKPIDNEMPIVRLRYPDRTEYVTLAADYGYIIDWQAADQSPTFYLFDRPNRKRLRFTDWNRFLHAMRSLPAGITIDEVSKCTVSFSHYMPHEKWKALDALRKAKSMRVLSVADGPRHTSFCYCETTGFEVLYDEAR